MYCHDLEVMNSNPRCIELGVRSTSVQSHIWTKYTIKLLYTIIHYHFTLLYLVDTPKATIHNHVVHGVRWHEYHKTWMNNGHHGKYLRIMTLDCSTWSCFYCACCQRYHNSDVGMGRWIIAIIVITPMRVAGDRQINGTKPIWLSRGRRNVHLMNDTRAWTRSSWGRKLSVCACMWFMKRISQFWKNSL